MAPTMPESNVNIGEGETTNSRLSGHFGLTNLQTRSIIIGSSPKTPKAQAESHDEHFKTMPEPPTVVATPFTKTAEGYVINGTVNPHGAETSYHFEFGTTTAYGTISPRPMRWLPGAATHRSLSR